MWMMSIGTTLRGKKKRVLLRENERRRMMLRKKGKMRLKKKKRSKFWIKKKDGGKSKREGLMSVYMPHHYLFLTKQWKKIVSQVPKIS